MPWTKQQIIDYVNKRTENRAATKIDLSIEFWLAVDQFVTSRRYWWTKKRFTFTTVIGSQIYDLSLSAASGNTQPGGGLTDYAQLERLILLPPTGQPIVVNGIPNTTDLTPIFDPAGQLAAINNPVQDLPRAYFIDVQTSLTTLYLQAPANVAQTILGTYWAIPQVTDPSTDTIPPWIPGFLHWGLFPALERRVFQFLYGEEDPRYTVADNQYEEFLDSASNIDSWSSERVREVAVNNSTVDIIQAHS